MTDGRTTSDPTTRTSEEAPHRLPVRTLVAASVGNAVEWYDWTVYATFSIYFATQIFPASNESLAFLGTFATYAYDAVGRRLSKRDRGGAVHYYVYDDADLVQELVVVLSRP